MINTGSDVLAQAKYLVDDVVESPQALSIINNGLDDLAVEAPPVKTHIIILPANNRTAPLPDDCISVIAVKRRGKDLDEMFPGDYDPERTGANVMEYAVVGNLIEFAPLPTTENELLLVYHGDYGHLVDIGTAISELPRHFRMGLVFWLAMHHRFNNEDRDWSILMSDEYHRYRTALRQYQDNRGGYGTPVGG